MSRRLWAGSAQAMEAARTRLTQRFRADEAKPALLVIDLVHGLGDRLSTRLLTYLAPPSSRVPRAGRRTSRGVGARMKVTGLAIKWAL